MKRPVLILKINPGVAVACMFKDDEAVALFKTEFTKDSTETPVEFEVKKLTVMMGNVVLVENKPTL